MNTNLIKKENKSIFKIRYVLGRTPYLLFEILYFIYAVFTVVFTELFEGEQYGVLPFNIIGDYIGFLLSVLLLSGTLFFIARKYFNVKVNIPIFTMCWILFLGNTIALLCFPSTLERYNPTAPDFVYHLSESRRWEYLFMYLNSCMFIYITYACVPKCKVDKSYFKYIAYIFLFIIYFSVIYSYLTESDVYSSFFNSNLEKDSHIASFLGDKNIFGMALFLAMIIHMKFLYETRRYINLAFSIILFAHIVLSGCKSATLAGIVLLFGYLIVIAYEKWKVNKKISIIILSILAFLMIFLTMIIFIPTLQKISILKKLANTITGQFTEKNSTFYSRLKIWEKFFDLVNFSPLYFIFGLGTMNFNLAFLYARDNNDAKFWHMHNGILEPWGEGGIIRFAINIIFFCYIIYTLFKMFKKTKDSRLILYFVILMSFVVRQLLEPEFLLSTSMLSICSIIVVAVPIFTYKTQLEKEVVIKKEGVILPIKYPLIRLLYLLPTALITAGILTDKLIYRASLILAGFIIQVIGYYFNMRRKSYMDKDERKYNEFSFLMILDIVISLEAIICLFVFEIDVAEYLFSILFSYTFAFTFYYFNLETSKLDDELSFIKKHEIAYEKDYLKAKVRNEQIVFNCSNKVEVCQEEMIKYYDGK